MKNLFFLESKIKKVSRKKEEDAKDLSKNSFRVRLTVGKARNKTKSSVCPLENNPALSSFPFFLFFV